MLHQPRTARSDLNSALSRGIENLNEAMVIRSSDKKLFNPCSGDNGRLHEFAASYLDQQASVMTTNLKRLIANAEKARSSSAAIPSLAHLEGRGLKFAEI